MSIALYLMELTAYDIGGAASVTLRYSSPVGFITGPSETPASTPYDPRLITPMPVKRDLFESGATSGHATIDLGFVELQNADGALDTLLTYGYGRQLVLRRGTVGAAYPSGFTTIYDGTALSVEGNGDRLTVKLRSLQLDLEQPFQATKYDGDNVPPDGLEGGPDDLLGKPKPVCYGQVKNVPAVQVNPQRLIFQVNDGATTSLDAVYDAGLALTAGNLFAIQTSGFSSTNIRGLVYGASIHVAVGDSGTLTSSPDAQTWTSRTSSFSTSHIYAGAYDGSSAFLIVGQSGKCATSSNGTSWSAGGTIAGGSQDMRAVVWFPAASLWIAGGTSGSIATSPDAATWTNRTNPFSGSDTIFGLAVSATRIVAVGTTGRIATSEDGITWVLRTDQYAFFDFRAVAYDGAQFVAVGLKNAGANNVLSYSPDGVTWTSITSPIAGGTGLYSLVYGASWLAGGALGGFATSADGTSWIERTTPFGFSVGNDINAASYGGGLYVVAGNAGKLMSSVTAAYANATDLEDDDLTPNAGEYVPYLAGGYFRLGAPPAGQVTADVSQGANDAARTQAQLAALVLQRAGKSAGTAAGNYLSADLTALDSADSSVRGIWINEETTFAAVLDELMAPGSAWYLDRQGRYRLVQFTAPSGSSTFTITENDIRKGGIVRVTLAKDDVSNVPTWRTKVQYAKNYTVQTSGLAGAVTDARRAFLAQEYREAIDEDTAVQTPHPLAVESIYPSTIVTAAAAATEAARLQTLRGTLRHCFDVTVPLNDDYATVDLNDVGTLQHSRYGLSAGVLHRVIGVHPDAAGEWITLRLWR